LANILTRDKADYLSLFVGMDVPGENPLEYELTLTPKGVGYSISREVLTQLQFGFTTAFKHIDSLDGDIRYYETVQQHLVRPNWEHNPFETSLAQVPKMFKESEELRRILGSVTQYHVLDVGARAPIKLPQQMKPANLPGADGEDLIPFLYSLHESNRDRYEAIEDALKTAFPSFESLSFPPVATGMLTMTWKDVNFDKPFFMHELSEGTLRFLWLVSLLQSPELTTVTMIDEPEVSLHPELLSILADLMRESTKRTQLIVATHSDRLIRFLEPKEVAVMDSNDDGYTTTTWGDSLWR
jgi:predicted ATPase